MSLNIKELVAVLYSTEYRQERMRFAASIAFCFYLCFAVFQLQGCTWLYFVLLLVLFSEQKN